MKINIAFYYGLGIIHMFFINNTWGDMTLLHYIYAIFLWIFIFGLLLDGLQEDKICLESL